MSSFLGRGVPSIDSLFREVPHFTAAKEKPRNPDIPNTVFQCWMTRRVRSAMYNTWSSNVTNNPQFNFYMFNNTECRNFLRDHFEPRVLQAYDTLVPGAYKADLWRCCVLYKYGGVYLDVKFKIIAKLEELWEIVDDRQAYTHDTVPNSLYQGFMIARAGDEHLKRLIDKIVENVENRFYGESPIDLTGPSFLWRELPKDVWVPFRCRIQPNEKFEILFDDKQIFQEYVTYRVDQELDIIVNGTSRHYGQLWKERRIYKDA
jgi:mannosyltransferase OCH1-like enzyme